MFCVYSFRPIRLKNAVPYSFTCCRVRTYTDHLLLLILLYNIYTRSLSLAVCDPLRWWLQTVYVLGLFVFDFSHDNSFHSSQFRGLIALLEMLFYIIDTAISVRK